MNDEDDWALAVGGNGEAFGRVFDRHRARLLRHSYRLVSSFADAEDVIAICFLEAWRKRENVRFTDGSILPWLLLTATNTARNLNRSSRRYREVLEKLPAPDPSPDFATDGPSAVELAMKQLSKSDQQVLALCVLEGFTEREAATALGVPPGTVKSRLSRAKDRLFKLLQHHHTIDLSKEVRNGN